MRQAIQLALYIWATVGALVLIGVAVRWCLVLAGRSVADAVAVPAPLIGTVTVLLAGWWWVDLVDRGVRDLTPALCVLGATGAARWCWLQVRLRRLPSVQWDAALVAVLSTVLLIFQWRWLLNSGYLTAVGSNGDIAAYAQVAQHIQVSGFDDPGRIVGADLGHVARTDVTGAYLLLSFVQTVTRRPLNQVLVPALGAAVVALALAIHRLLKRHTSLPRPATVLISVSAQCSFLIAYLEGSYFLAQMIAMVLLVISLDGMMTMRWSGVVDGSPRVARVSGAATVAMTTGLLILVYPHMAFVALPMLVVCVLGRRGMREEVRFLLLLGVTGTFGGLLVIGKFGNAVSRFVSLSRDSVNGWPLPPFLPTHFLGFMNSETVRPTALHWFFSGATVAAVLAASWSGRTRHRFRRLPVVRLILFPLLPYLWIAASGASYRQWKWLTFFLPLLFVAILVPLASAVVGLSAKRAVPRVWSLVLCCVLVGNLLRPSAYLRIQQEESPRVDYPLTRIGSASALAGVDEININTGEYLLSMWPALFLGDRTVRIIQESYYTAPGPSRVPTLVRNDSVPAGMPGVVPVDARYSLLPAPTGPMSDGTDGLAATVTAGSSRLELRRGETATVQVTVTNTGTATWWGSATFRGAVNIGLRLRTSDGATVLQELGRSSLVPFPDVVPPGASRTVDVPVAVPMAGTYMVEIGPVSEYVAWFADLPDSERLLVPVEVS